MNKEKSAPRCASYKVWIHIEGLNQDGDTVEGDDYHEPREAGCFATVDEAERLRDALLVVADQ